MQSINELPFTKLRLSSVRKSFGNHQFFLLWALVKRTPHPWKDMRKISIEYINKLLVFEFSGEYVLIIQVNDLFPKLLTEYQMLAGLPEAFNEGLIAWVPEYMQTRKMNYYSQFEIYSIFSFRISIFELLTVLNCVKTILVCFD